MTQMNSMPVNTETLLTTLAHWAVELTQTLRLTRGAQFVDNVYQRPFVPLKVYPL